MRHTSCNSADSESDAYIETLGGVTLESEAEVAFAVALDDVDWEVEDRASDAVTKAASRFTLANSILIKSHQK